MAEMNEFAKRWVEALLSGKYKQGTGCLRNADNEFCCLGVALDVMAPDEWSTETEPRSINPDGNEIMQVYRHEPSHKTDFLPAEIWNKLTAGAVPGPHAMAKISGVNDSGATFEEIVKHYILPMWQTEEEQNDA